MPTKPATIPEIWASNTLYTTGPFIGDPTKVGPGATAQDGDRPGALFPTAAEHNNYQQYELTTWVATWLYLGTYDPDPDAHIVETDSTGRAGLHGCTINNTDATETALAVFSVATAPQIACLVTCTTGGTAIGASIGNASANAFQTATGTGANATGYHVDMGATPAGGSGMRVAAVGGTVGPGIRVTHAGSGEGVLVTHSGSSQGLLVNHSGTNAAIEVVHSGNVASAVAITAGVNARAILGIGSGTGAGAVFQSGTSSATAAVVAQALTSSAFGVDATGGSGGATGVGVRGTGAHADTYGVHGRTSALASATAAGVLGEGRGTGTIGVHALSTAGIALVTQADTVNPALPEMRFIGQNADPSSAPIGGEHLSNTTMRQLRHATGVGYFGIYQSGGTDASACLVNASDDGPFTSNSTVIWTTCLSVLLDASKGNGYYGTVVSAAVTIVIGMECRCQTAAAATVDLQVLDQSDGGTQIFARTSTGGALADGYRLPSAITDWQRSIVVAFQYVPPNEGDLDLDIEVRVGDGGGANIEVRDVWCQVWGTEVP